MLPPLIHDLGMELDIDYELQEDHVYIPMDGDDGEFLLGERGEGLNALQFLLNKMVYRGGPARLVLDVNGYRKERQDRLVAEAKEAARQVRETGRPETLGPMNPFERRLIHLALRDDPDVTTVSHGDSFLKRVEITTPRAAREGGGDRRGPSRRRRRPRNRGGRR
jgi:spoIIIJ-associated protein